MANVKQLKVNNTAYDIKDELIRKAVDTNGTASVDNLDTIKSDIAKAVEGSTSTNKKTVVEALAALKDMIVSAGGDAVTNVEWDATNKELTKTKSGSTTPVVTAAQLVTALRDTVTSSSSTSSTAGFTTPADAQMLIERAQVGAAMFQGILEYPDTEQGHDLPPQTYKAGYYWVVGTAGEYAGKQCEVGDFVYCIKDGIAPSSGDAWKDDFEVVQGNIDTSLFAKLADGTSSAPQTFTGWDKFNNPVQVATPTANNHAATKKYVDDAVNADKIQDYIIVETTSSVTHGGSAALDSNAVTDISDAFAANKMPILKVNMNALTKVVYIPLVGTSAGYYGSVASTADNKPISVYVQSGNIYLSNKPITSVTPTTGTVNAMTASYASEVITFTSSTPTVVTAVTAS